MTKRWFVLAAVTTVCMAVQAQMLYEVSGNGLKEKSYILGVHHLLPSGLLTTVPGVFRAFNQSERVVNEVQFVEELELNTMILRYGTAETPIDELLGLEEQVLVDSILRKDIGLGLQAVMMLKPAMIASLWFGEVGVSLYPRGEEDVPMDSYFQTMAELKGKEIRGLETFQEQMALLLHGTEEAQARELVAMMRDGKEKLRIDIEALTRMYADGDLEGVAAVEEREYSEAARLELIEGRTEKWFGQLVGMMKEKRCLVVVGAMNMTGDKGLLKALRAKGYIVKAVKE